MMSHLYTHQIQIKNDMKFCPNVYLKISYLVLIPLMLVLSSLAYWDENYHLNESSNKYLIDSDQQNSNKRGFEASSDQVIRNRKYKEYKSDSEHHSCDLELVQRNVNFRSNLAKIKTFDTLSQNDVVRNQYSNLPYPAVTLKDLNAEKSYYDNKKWIVNVYGELRVKPYWVTPGVTLEAINHFLYNGRNDFR